MKKFNPKEIKMIVGLGNPGSAYEATYHNAGFTAVNYLSGGFQETEWKRGKDFLYLKMDKSRTFQVRDKLILVKPSVFMNESGEAIKRALYYFKTKPENLLVIHDDSDIATGKYKIGFGRGAAGHRGVASLIYRLKTQEFWRARIGVRNRRGKAGDFILKKITPGDAKDMETVFQELNKILLL